MGVVEEVLNISEIDGFKHYFSALPAIIVFVIFTLLYEETLQFLWQSKTIQKIIVDITGEKIATV